MSRRRNLPSEPVRARIESLCEDGRGIAHVDGKAVFVFGALPGEEVLFTYTRKRRGHDEAAVKEVLTASPERVAPRCAHFGVCGGCSLQHLRGEAQIRLKEQALGEALAQIGKVPPVPMLPPLTAGHWGYRRKARLGVKYVARKGRVLVGFRERGSSFIAELSRCEVLHPHVGAHLTDLAELVAGLGTREQIPQIEVSMGDRLCALVFRLLAPPTDQDLDALRNFGERHGFLIYLQEGGPETIRPLSSQPSELRYRLPRFALTLRFSPNDFTQVNLEMNRLLVDRALKLVDPGPDQRVLDLFCGLGNFTLPLASRAALVIGVEGDPGLVARAKDNAARNNIRNTRFYSTDLYAMPDNEPWLLQGFDQALLDPPRSGALEVLPHLPRLGISRILYISCYPATLARDAGVLVNELGYRLQSAGVMDMFPHTAHVESIALFEKPGNRSVSGDGS